MNPLDKLISGAFTKVAQHACRLGEKGNREWPPLVNLLELESWEMVGEKYSKELALEIVKLYFEKGNFIQDLIELAGRNSEL